MRARWSLLAAFLATLALSACNLFDETRTYRYRMTVEVDTPGGLKTGSSVIEVDARLETNPASPATKRINIRTRGEAVAVDLPNGRALFALMDKADGIAGAAFDPPRYRYDVENGYLKRIDDLKDMEGVAVVPRRAYPMLVTFADLDDPTSVARVDPDDLATSFGAGVRLKRITVQMTNDRVTTGIEERLSWLGTYPEPSLDPTHGPRDYSLPATLHHGAFRTGVTQ